jgi:hypothetical protein
VPQGVGFELAPILQKKKILKAKNIVLNFK